jgi:hypothetical protein
VLLKQRGAVAAPTVLARHPVRSAINLFRSKWWTVGWLVALGAWLLHVGALSLASLSTVQAVISGGLVFLAILAERFFGFHLGRRQGWASWGDTEEASVMRGFHILVAGSLLGFPRERARGQRPSAPRAPARDAVGNHLSSGSATGDQRRTRGVNHRGPSSTPELFACANLGRVTTASVAAEVVAMSLWGGVSECWEHGPSPSCQLRGAVVLCGRRTACGLTEVIELEGWCCEQLHWDLL